MYFKYTKDKKNEFIVCSWKVCIVFSWMDSMFPLFCTILKLKNKELQLWMFLDELFPHVSYSFRHFYLIYRKNGKTCQNNKVWLNSYKRTKNYFQHSEGITTMREANSRNIIYRIQLNCLFAQGVYLLGIFTSDNE